MGRAHPASLIAQPVRTPTHRDTRPVSRRNTLAGEGLVDLGHVLGNQFGRITDHRVQPLGEQVGVGAAQLDQGASEPHRPGTRSGVGEDL